MWQKPDHTYDAAGNLKENFYDATICVPGEKGCIAFPTFVRASPQCGEGRIIVGEKLDGDLYFAQFNPTTNINDLVFQSTLQNTVPFGLLPVDGDKIKANEAEISSERKQKIVEAEDKYRRYKEVVRWDGDDNTIEEKDALDPKKNPFAVPIAKPSIPQGMDNMAFHCVDPNNISAASERPSLYRPKPHKWRDGEYYCPANEMGYKGYCLKKYYYDAQQREACDRASLEDGCRNFQTVSMRDRTPFTFSDRPKYYVPAKGSRDSTYANKKIYEQCLQATPDNKTCIESRQLTYYCPNQRHMLELNYEQRKMFCVDPYSRPDQTQAQPQPQQGYVPINDPASRKVWYCPNASDIIVNDPQQGMQCANATVYDKYMNAFPMNRCQKAYNTDCMLGHTLPINEDDQTVDWSKVSTTI